MENSKDGRSSPVSPRDEIQTVQPVKEEPDSEIKDYAESTMNELLGLYGFDKLNSKETENLNLERYTNSNNVDDRLSPIDDASHDDVSVDSCDSSSERSDLSKFEKSRSDSETSLAAQHRNLVTALTKKHGLTGAPEGTIPSGSIVCAWCQKIGVKLFTLKTNTTTKTFCSELCFDQCRRASFKQNKICDWCKHVRHTVNYVDFQDGETQLQFCSSKCLNQYKMNIFCKETQEHLKQISPTSDKKDNESSSDNKILITPELWLKNASHKNKRKDQLSNNDDKTDKSTKGLLMKSEPKFEAGRHHTSASDATSDRLPVTNRSICDKIHREKNRKSTTRETQSTSLPNSNSPEHMTSGPTAGFSFVPNHMWGPTFGMGMTPMGSIPPWMYPGFFPQGFMPPNISFDNMSPPRTDTSSKRSPMYESDSAPSSQEGRVTTPRHSSSARSNTPRSSTPRNNVIMTSPNRPPPMQPADTSAITPGVPGMFPNYSNSAVFGGAPPMTMIMPFPIPLPLPVPIPLPLPITMEKIMEVYYKNKDKSEFPTVSNIKSEPCIQGHSENTKGDINENDNFNKDRLSCTSCSSERSESVDSCVSPMSEYRVMAQSDTIKRSFPANIEGTLDLSKRPRLDDSLSDSCDGAIDLSNNSLNRHKVYKGKENKDSIDSDSSIHSSDTAVEPGLKVPKIHIISPRHEPPLSQQLPLPPVDPKYANRRGLILDAPSVPKKPRSPSPDRRSYARSVPKDVMDAARRRCMRARIRTK